MKMGFKITLAVVYILLAILMYNSGLAQLNQPDDVSVACGVATLLVELIIIAWTIEILWKYFKKRKITEQGGEK